MDTNVSTLLREFPKIRRAALSGERVTVHTREGDLWIMAAQKDNVSAFGGIKGALLSSADDLEASVTAHEDWEVSL